MKNPILLKLLQSCGTKATPNFPNTRSRKGDQGFTLLEVVVIALILGILSAIAAPSWLAFINRQRVRTVNDRVFQTIRTAQSEAKRTKSDRAVTFNPSDDPPTVTINTVPALTSPLQTVTFDAGGEIKKGQVKLSAASCPAGVCTAATALTFKYNGVVDVVDPNIPKLPLVVTVSAVDGGTKQCVIVETIIGGMRTDEGQFDTTTGQGCP